MFGSRFLDKTFADFENELQFWKAMFNFFVSIFQAIRHLRYSTPKRGSTRPTVVYALHKWLISIFSKTT